MASRRASRASLAGLFAAALGAGALLVTSDSPCEVESTYHCARVIADPVREGGRTLQLDDLAHSYVDLDDPRHLEFDYTRWIADAIDGLPGGALSAVFVGGGGFTLPRWLAARRPGSRSRVLEVDPGVVELARRRLGLRTSGALSVIEGDARVSMRTLPTASADLVVGDAFGAAALPWHLATVEWSDQVKRVLRPGGLYALNVIDSGSLRLLRAEAATLLATFADVRAIERPGAEGGNFVLLASERPLGRRVRSRARGARTLDRAEVARLASGVAPLRDDQAPADQLLSTQ